MKKGINMNKLKFMEQAKDLYLVENLLPDEIAKRLGISRRTIFYWIKKYKWNKKLNKITNFAEQFAPEIYSTGLTLIEKLSTDIDTRQPFCKDEIRYLCEVIKLVAQNEKGQFEKTKETKKQEAEKPKGLTPEFIKEIRRDYLNWET